jgi:hypothetical protein
MVSILYKWFFVLAGVVFLTGARPHPIYVSVTEMELNRKEKTLEISCKLFTDDFEKALRSSYKTPVDLINPASRAAMDKLVNAYVQAHLKITADGKLLNLKYLGYEVIEEGVFSYYESAGIDNIKNVSLFNNLLYEYNSQQMGLVHITVNGSRKSTKLNNPVDRAVVVF